MSIELTPDMSRTIHDAVHVANVFEAWAGQDPESLTVWSEDHMPEIRIVFDAALAAELWRKGIYEMFAAPADIVSGWTTLHTLLVTKALPGSVPTFVYTLDGNGRAETQYPAGDISTTAPVITDSGRTLSEATALDRAAEHLSDHVDPGFVPGE